MLAIFCREEGEEEEVRRAVEGHKDAATGSGERRQRHAGEGDGDEGS